VGSAGYGLSWQNAPQERPDQAPLANLTAVIRWLDSRGLVDVKRVAVIGEGLGGYLALRTLEDQPELLRSAVAINAPVDLRDLGRNREAEQQFRDSVVREATHRLRRDEVAAKLAGEGSDETAQMAAKDEAMIQAAMEASGRPLSPPIDFGREFYSWYFKQFKNLRDASVLSHAGRITKPVLLLHNPAERYAPITPIHDLHDRMQRRGQDAAFAMIPAEFAAGSLEVRKEVVWRIGEFLNVTLYDFEVKLGESKEVQ
jgi:dipeptidyl aminopeptidase/acylaminoacyl peptidase